MTLTFTDNEIIMYLYLVNSKFSKKEEQGT